MCVEVIVCYIIVVFFDTVYYCHRNDDLAPRLYRCSAAEAVAGRWYNAAGQRSPGRRMVDTCSWSPSLFQGRLTFAIRWPTDGTVSVRTSYFGDDDDDDWRPVHRNCSTGTRHRPDGFPLRKNWTALDVRRPSTAVLKTVPRLCSTAKRQRSFDGQPPSVRS